MTYAGGFDVAMVVPVVILIFLAVVFVVGFVLGRLSKR